MGGETERGVRERLRQQRTMQCGMCGRRFVQGATRLVDVLMPYRRATSWTVECAECRQGRLRGFWRGGRGEALR